MYFSYLQIFKVVFSLKCIGPIFFLKYSRPKIKLYLKVICDLSIFEFDRYQRLNFHPKTVDQTQVVSLGDAPEVT